MGLVRASIITTLCYLFLFKIWNTNLVPIPEKIKQIYDKYILLTCIFLIELLW